MLFDSPIPLAKQKANRMNEPTGRSLGWEIAQRDCRERNRQKVSGRWAPTRWMPAPFSSPQPSARPSLQFQVGSANSALGLVWSREEAIAGRRPQSLV